MTSPFRQLHHICLVVHDIDATIAYYKGLGIGPWQDYPPLSQCTDLNVPNPEAFGQMKYRYVDLDNVQIQLCEPRNSTARSAASWKPTGKASSTSDSSPTSTRRPPRRGHPVSTSSCPAAGRTGVRLPPGRKYDTGLMAGKLALVSVTTGTSADTYAPDGIDGAILDILWPVHNGILRYTGFGVLEPFVTHMPGKIGRDERRVVLGRYAGEIRALASRKRLFFHPRDDYGSDGRLLPGVRPQSGFQHRNCG